MYDNLVSLVTLLVLEFVLLRDLPVTPYDVIITLVTRPRDFRWFVFLRVHFRFRARLVTWYSNPNLQGPVVGRLYGMDEPIRSLCIYYSRRVLRLGPFVHAPWEYKSIVLGVKSIVLLQGLAGSFYCSRTIILPLLGCIKSHLYLHIIVHVIG